MPNPASHSSQRAARDFLRRIREVYKLITPAELGHVWLAGNVLVVGHRVSRSSQHGWPVALSNGMYLNVQMTLQIDRESTEPPHRRLETTRATYTYQAGDDLDEPMPVFSYQFDRTASSPYPRCHLHVHADPTGYSGTRSFPQLHLPTRRITLEQVVWHLIQEHDVEPRRPDWHEVLWRHEEWFRDIQKVRDWPYDRPFDSPRAN